MRRNLSQKVLSVVSAAALAGALFVGCPSLVRAEPGAVVTSSPDEVARYQRFEAAIEVSTSATNPYFPYDPEPPIGVPAGAGVSVDALFLPPGESDWDNAKVQPCFWHQPMTEARGDFYPEGSPSFQVRFAPDTEGEWRYKIRVTDAEGTAESDEGSFTCAGTNSKGFVRVSPTDPRFFEHDDGTPFFYPLVEQHGWGDFSTQDNLLATLGNNGVKLVRWWMTPRGEFAVWGGTTALAWGGRTVVGENGQGESGFALAPVDWTHQTLGGLPVGTQVRLSCRAKLTGQRALTLSIQGGGISDAGTVVSPPTDGWQTVTTDTFTVTATDAIRCYFAAPDDSAFSARSDILIDDMAIEISTDGGDTWRNAASRVRADTHTYMDDRQAYSADRFLSLCEAQGVYSKMTITDKDDFVLTRLRGEDHYYNDEPDENNTYAAQNDGDNPNRWYQQAWWRYFIARWSAFQSVFGLEFANETDPFNGNAQDAAYAMADYFHANSPRSPLMSNSTWHSFVRSYWADSRMDHANIHAYVGPLTPTTGTEGARYFWGLTGEEPEDNTGYHPWTGGNPNGPGRVFTVEIPDDAPNAAREVRTLAYVGGLPGRRYRVSAQVRGSAVIARPDIPSWRAGIWLAAYQGYTAENDPEGAGLNVQVPLGTYEWQQVTTEPFVMPLNKDILAVQVDMLGPGGTLWVDDVAVEEEIAAGEWRRIYLHTWDESRVDLDSALDVRAYWTKLNAFHLQKPIVRGETGLRGWMLYGNPVTFDGQDYYYGEENQELVRDVEGVYYQKKIWAQLGCPGFYSGQLWTDNLIQKDLWYLYGAYTNFITGEPISNGNYSAVGSDRDADEALEADGGLRCWGLRDRTAGRALLWIDNPDHTWKNVVDEAPIPAKSGQVAVPDFENGSYTIEWWDTRSGQVTERQQVSVTDGTLRLDVENLQTDVAVKVIPD